ncbi:molybdopterin molybdenumtransferase MoeA [Sulfolobales archaeon HS-7]|nr:molybdopterin molybdenumtransferase MoeA [Sulfolobales archaeon HS-7]
MRITLNDEELITLDEARERLSKLIRRQVVEVNLLDSLNFISAEEVYANINLPPFSRSTVDGYAIKSELSPGDFAVIDKVEIGEAKEVKVEGRQAVEVDTGSILPHGANAVVKVEDTSRRENHLLVGRKVNPWDNVAIIGSDISKSTMILGKGERISAYKVSLLASQGISKVRVYKPMSVSIIITGNEIIEPGVNSYFAPKIFDSNGYFLQAAFKEMGSTVIRRVYVTDVREKVEKEILTALNDSDLIITVGGTSAGERDYVNKILIEKGTIIFYGIDIKPGKPTIASLINDKVVVGLPGNPVSATIVFEELVKSILDFTERREIIANSLNEIKGDRRRDAFLPAILLRGKSQVYAYLPPFDSYMIGAFTLSDGYVHLRRGESVNVNEPVSVKLINTFSGYTVIGEEEPSLSFSGISRILYAGSSVACEAMKRGVGDVLIISSEICEPKEFDFEIKRKIVRVGSGESVGYIDGVGISKFVDSPSIKVKSPSAALSLSEDKTVYLPSTFGIKGEEVGEETIYVVINESELKGKVGVRRNL